MPREVLVSLVQATLRCAGDDAIAAVDAMVRAEYVVERIEDGVRSVRLGPRADPSTPLDGRIVHHHAPLARW